MRHDQVNEVAAHWRCLGVMVMLLAGMVLCTAVAQAKSIPFKSGTTELQFNDNPLREVLPRFFQSQGLDVVLSPGVAARTGTINGKFPGTYQSIWEKLARSNNLTGYYDGSRVYVYLDSERETDFTSVPMSVEQPFMDAMSRVGWRDDRNKWSLEPSTGLVTINGVPRFIQQVKQMAGTVSNLSQGSTTAFKFYPLKYAWAADTTINIGNQESVIPGVASVLRSLVGQNPDGFGTARRRMLPSRQQGLRGNGMAAVGNGNGNDNGNRLPPPLGDYSQPQNDMSAQDNNVIASGSPGMQSITGSGNVRIVADSFRNAIIVRDRPDRLPMYDDLIRQLDVPQQMIEIEATIIDVNKSKLRQWGIDWYYRNGRTTVGFAPNTSAKQKLLGALGAGDTTWLDHLFGFQIGAILGDPAHFVARVNALEDDGVTHVVTHPQVITMNDVPAVIEKSETIYVPVSGAYSTDLYNIIAGTTLRVTPHVVKDSGQSFIRMRVQIKDGGYTLQKKDASDVRYPIVQENAVNTQAIIRNGQGLLLGGMVLDSLDNTETKVPILGDIPLIGYLFKHTKKERNHVERLFLITPRLVMLNHITGQRTPSSANVSIDTQEQLDKQQKSKDAWWNFKGNKTRQPAPLPAMQPDDMPAGMNAADMKKEPGNDKRKGRRQ